MALLAALITFSCLVAGCRREASAPAQNADASRTVTVTGCVMFAPGSSRFALNHVEVGSSSAAEWERPRVARESSPDPSEYITPRSWVRVATEDPDELLPYMGQLVTVTGPVVDTGRSTIGTSGTSGAESATGEQSQAAADKHHSRKVAAEAGPRARYSMANGLAPEIAAQEIKSTGRTCSPSH